MKNVTQNLAIKKLLFLAMAFMLIMSFNVFLVGNISVRAEETADIVVMSDFYIAHRDNEWFNGGHDNSGEYYDIGVKSATFTRPANTVATDGAKMASADGYFEMIGRGDWTGAKYIVLEVRNENAKTDAYEGKSAFIPQIRAFGSTGAWYSYTKPANTQYWLRARDGSIMQGPEQQHNQFVFIPAGFDGYLLLKTDSLYAGADKLSDYLNKVGTMNFETFLHDYDYKLTFGRVGYTEDETILTSESLLTFDDESIVTEDGKEAKFTVTSDYYATQKGYTWFDGADGWMGGSETYGQTIAYDKHNQSMRISASIDMVDKKMNGRPNSIPTEERDRSGDTYMVIEVENHSSAASCFRIYVNGETQGEMVDAGRPLGGVYYCKDAGTGKVMLGDTDAIFKFAEMYKIAANFKGYILISFEELGRSEELVQNFTRFSFGFYGGEVRDLTIGRIGWATAGFAEDGVDFTIEDNSCYATGELDENGHRWSWETTSIATCTTPAVETRVCEICGETGGTREGVLDATNHTGEQVIKIAATCTEDGIKEWDCCHAEGDTIPKTGHTGEQVVKIAATCTEDGIKEWDCCHAEGDTIPKTGHTFGEWVVVKEATEEEEGVKQRTCHCGFVESEPIPKIVKSGCGAVLVTSYAGLVGILLATACAGLLVFKKRKIN